MQQGYSKVELRSETEGGFDDPYLDSAGCLLLSLNCLVILASTFKPLFE